MNGWSFRKSGTDAFGGLLQWAVEDETGHHVCLVYAAEDAMKICDSINRLADPPQALPPPKPNRGDHVVIRHLPEPEPADTRCRKMNWNSAGPCRLGSGHSGYCANAGV